jgi:hypothetical protein
VTEANNSPAPEQEAPRKVQRIYFHRVGSPHMEDTLDIPLGDDPKRHVDQALIHRVLIVPAPEQEAPLTDEQITALAAKLQHAYFYGHGIDSAADKWLAVARAALAPPPKGTRPLGMVRIDADGTVGAHAGLAEYERQKFPGDWRPYFVEGTRPLTEPALTAELLADLKVQYGMVGTRDVDVAAWNAKLDRAIAALSAPRPLVAEPPYNLSATEQQALGRALHRSVTFKDDPASLSPAPSITPEQWRELANRPAGDDDK